MIARTRMAGLALAVATLGGLRASAADEVVRGVVVRTEAREIFVNLGIGRGVADGAELRIKRPITLRHPVTRAPVADWLPIGEATVTQAGGALTMAVLSPDLRSQVAVGDVVEVYVVRDDRPTVAPPPPVTGEPLPQVDADTAEVLRLWRQVGGATLDVRISTWEGWLASHASSPHASAIAEDLEALRAQREAAAPRQPTAERALVTLGHNAPGRATAGHDLPLVFVIDHPAAVASASLHYRRRGATTYQRALLSREHGVYLRGTIPAAAMTQPGVEYFVEAVGPRGDSGAAVANPERPHVVEVDPPPLVTVFDPEPGRVRLSLRTTYLDFATFDHRKVDGAEVDRTDRFSFTELDVLYRLRGPIWGVRVGFGSYGGVGGKADGVWTDEAPAPEVGFQYGYVEAEARGQAEVPIGGALRLYAGVGNEGFGAGVDARLRIGDADGNNLSASLGTIDGLGFLTELRLETWPRPRWPIGMAVAVTDQPGGSDLGVRMSTDVGWQARSWVRPTVRLSWQGRNTAHAGVGGGLGLVFDW